MDDVNGLISDAEEKCLSSDAVEAGMRVSCFSLAESLAGDADGITEAQDAFLDTASATLEASEM